MSHPPPPPAAVDGKTSPPPALRPGPSAPAPEPGGRDRFLGAFRGLIWAEWFAHSKLLLVFLGLWLVTVWVLPAVAHPGWILLLGGVYALLAGPAYGGGDVLEGCEEFTLALPATRTERFLARVVVGAGTLFVLTAMNLGALGLDLPHVLARLYIDTGLIEPLPVLKTGLLYGLILALPWAAFCIGFALSAATHSRALVLTAWLWAASGALAILQLGLWYEEHVWESPNGFLTCPLLIAMGVLALLAGHHFYSRKEAGQPSAPLTLPGRWWLWALVVLIAATLALNLVSSLVERLPQFLR